MKTVLFKQKLFIFILMTFLLFEGACNSNLSKEEKFFKDTVRNLNTLIVEYNKIPENETVWEKIPNKERVIYRPKNYGKDEGKLSNYYIKTVKEWETINSNLLKIANSKESHQWKFDSIFCRAVLYNTWVLINRKKSIAEETIKALNDYIAISSEGRLKKWTKKILKHSILDDYRELFYPNFSDEKNLSIIFQFNIAAQYMKLKEYKKAIEYYEAIVNNYPASHFAGNAKQQISVCNEFIEGRAPDYWGKKGQP